MKSKMRSYLRAILGAVAALAFAAPALASPITYTEVGTGSGTLDGTSFTNQLVTITMTADTTNIIDGSTTPFNSVGTTTVTVSAVGADTVPDAFAFVNQNNPVAGFADALMSPDSTADLPVINSTVNSVFASYALGAIGPTSGPSLRNQATFATGSGTFSLSSMGDTTFCAASDGVSCATVGAVPLPATLPLFATGLAGLGLIGWRRKRKAH